MRVCGVDPGERVGWAVLEVDPAGGPPRHVASGAVDRTGIPLIPGCVPGDAGRIDVISVEMPAGVHGANLKGGPARAAGVVRGLLVACELGATILADARHAGLVTVRVDAAAARRNLGVKIGARKGPPCEPCSGSGAGDDMTEGRALRAEAVLLQAENARRARGKRGRLRRLAAIRLRAEDVCPCPSCDGSGEQKPPSVDQQIAQLLPGAVAGWPERSNVHERDAAVTALHAIKKILTAASSAD